MRRSVDGMLLSVCRYELVTTARFGILKTFGRYVSTKLDGFFCLRAIWSKLFHNIGWLWADLNNCSNKLIGLSTDGYKPALLSRSHQKLAVD